MKIVSIFLTSIRGVIEGIIYRIKRIMKIALEVWLEISCDDAG